MANDNDNDGGLGFVGWAIVGAVMLLFVSVWTTWHHPVVVTLLAASAYIYVFYGPWWLLAFWVTLALVLVTWWSVGRASFDRSVSWRARGSWRGLWVYGRRWHRAMTMSDLGDTYDGDQSVPKLRRVHSNTYMDRCSVKLLPGQHPQDLAKRADTLAHTFGLLGCRVRMAGPGRVHLDFVRVDLLTRTVPALPIPSDELPDLAALPVARAENGEPWLLGILGRHILIAGATGSGKGSVLQSTIRAVAPTIQAGLLRLYGIDPKGGMELAAAGAEALYTRLVRDDPEEQAALLEQLVDLMRSRARRLAGVTRLHTPTVDEPLIVLVIDELAALTAYRSKTKDGRELYGRIDMAINLLLSQGRAVGIILITALQDPRKEVLPNRDLFPMRIALRLVEAQATDMVLGSGARDLGADCSRISPNQPGVAWVWADGDPEPTRVRFAYPTDDDIRDVATTYGPNPPVVPAAEAIEPVEVIDLTVPADASS